MRVGSSSSSATLRSVPGSGSKTPSRMTSNTIRRTRVKPLEWRPEEARPITTSPGRTAGKNRALELRPPAVGRQTQDGFAVLRGHAEDAPKPAEPADHFGPARRACQRRDAAYRVRARVDIDAGLAVGERFHVSRRRAEAAASTRAPCLRGSSR